MRGLSVLGAAYVALSMLASAVVAEQGGASIVTAGPLLRRQDDDERKTTTPTPRATARQDDEPEATAPPNRNTGTNRNPTPTPTGDEDEPEETATGKKTSSTSSRTRRPNLLDPAGGITMKNPVTTEGSIYYKFGQKVTFEWNMTSVQVSPTNLNVEAYCTLNSHYYTVTANMSAQATKVVWDTEKVMSEDIRLVQATYSLWIYDASKPRSAAPTAGYLAAFNQLRFAMYQPNSYVPHKEFKCTGCTSDSSSVLAAGSVKTLMLTCFISLASAMWFMGVAMF